MAKYAILSDIHANGDIVGYNAEPRECLYLVRDLNWAAMVRGNHDEYTANGNTEMSGFNPHAKFAVNWTRQQLTEAERAWLVGMPYRSTVPGTNSTIVHAGYAGELGIHLRRAPRGGQFLLSVHPDLLLRSLPRAGRLRQEADHHAERTEHR